MQRASNRTVMAPVLAVLLACCHRISAPQRHEPDPLAVCGTPAALNLALAGELARAHPPEASPLGRCVVDAANRGSDAAAMLLADVYRRALSGMSGGGAVALRLDLFGRYVGWLRVAGERGYAPAQLLLAQAIDSTAYGAMPDNAFAWYQAAGEAGSSAALAAIGTAYSKGRIPDERLYDLRNWLSLRGRQSPGEHQLQRLLAKPPAIAPPG